MAYLTTSRHTRTPSLPGVAPRWLAGIRAHSTPYKGVGQTVDLIHAQTDRLAHSPYVRGVTETIVRGVYGKDYLSEIAAIYYWSCDPRNIRYMRDPARVELVKDTQVVLETRQADCDELDVTQANMVESRRAAWAGAMASQAGNHAVEGVVVGFGPDGLSHTFPRVLDPRGTGRMVVMDPVAGPLTPRMLRSVRRLESTGPLGEGPSAARGRKMLSGVGAWAGAVQTPWRRVA